MMLFRFVVDVLWGQVDSLHAFVGAILPPFAPRHAVFAPCKRLDCKAKLRIFWQVDGSKASFLLRVTAIFFHLVVDIFEKRCIFAATNGVISRQCYIKSLKQSTLQNKRDERQQLFYAARGPASACHDAALVRPGVGCRQPNGLHLARRQRQTVNNKPHKKLRELW